MMFSGLADANHNMDKLYVAIEIAKKNLKQGRSINE